MKVGRSSDPHRRVVNANTWCPNRDYELRYAVPFDDSLRAEATVHERLGCFREGGTEWFHCSVAVAKGIIDHIKENP